MSTTAPLVGQLGLAERRPQLPLQRARERVQLLGPLELHDADGAFAADGDEGAHRRSSLICVGRGHRQLADRGQPRLRHAPVGPPHADDRERPALLAEHRRRGAVQRILELADTDRVPVARARRRAPPRAVARSVTVVFGEALEPLAEQRRRARPASRYARNALPLEVACSGTCRPSQFGARICGGSTWST